MKKLFLFLILLAFEPRLATAQDAKTAVVPEKVTYSRAIPKGLRAFVPRGGKSRFWGATKLKYNGQQVWVHVYDVGKAIFPKSDGNSDGVQKSGLDLFVLSTSGVKRISSTPFTYLRWGNYQRGAELETVSVKTLWLDYNAKKRPIVWVCLENPNGFVGPIASGLFITFEKGFKNFVAQSNFNCGNDNSGGFNAWDTSFVINQKGELNIIYTYDSNGNVSRTTYQWENNLFRPFEKQEKRLNEEKYHPIPLTPRAKSSNL